MVILSQLLIITMILLNTSPIDIPTKTPAVASYIWHAENIENNPDTYLNFSKSQGVTDLYIQYSGNLSITSYQEFIQSAHDQSIKVHLLDGAPRWALRGNKKELDKLLTWLKSYQKISAPEEQFDGLHLDIEFYLLDLNDKQEKQAIKEYMKRINTASKFSTENDLALSVSIPFWFDDVLIDDRSSDKSLAEWNIRKVPTTVIMAYRNQSFGSNSITSIIKEEIAYAEAADNKLLIGLETRHSSEGDYLSFYGLPNDYLKTTLSDLVYYYADQPSVHGFAIHHLDSWIELYKE